MYLLVGIIGDPKESSISWDGEDESLIRMSSKVERTSRNNS